MIQEILGCWWTKSTFLTATKEEILALASDETKLNYLAKNISLILDDDDFFYTSPELMEKLCYFFYEKRFASKHTKETVTNLNRILDTIHEYKSMSKYELNPRIKKWVKEERKNHGVDIHKKVFQGPESLYQLIKEDYYNVFYISGNDLENRKYYTFYILTTITAMLSKNVDIEEIAKYIPNMELICDTTEVSNIKINIMISRIQNRLEYLNDYYEQYQIYQKEKQKKKEMNKNQLED